MQVSIYATVIGGDDTAAAVSDSAAKVGWESDQTRPPDRYDVEFVDYPFTSGGVPFDEHLAAVRREEPEVAVAPDIQAGRDAETVYSQADDLAEHADTVVVVPKDVHPSDVPDRFRVGLPLANWDARPEGDVDDPDDWVDPSGEPELHQWTDYQDAGEVHLLGGSPAVQLAVSKHFVDVASLDGSAIFVGAGWGDYWHPDGWKDTHPEMTDYYELATVSLDNMAAAWADRYGYEPADPDAPFHAGRRAGAKELIESGIYDPSRERSRARQQARGPPMVDESDLSALPARDRDEFEAVDWAEEMGNLERSTIERIEAAAADTPEPDATIEADQDTTGYQEPLATDGGMTPYDPTQDVGSGGLDLPEGWRFARDSTPVQAGEDILFSRDFENHDTGRIETEVLTVSERDDGYRVITPIDSDEPNATYETIEEAKNFALAYMEEHPGDDRAKEQVVERKEARREKELEREKRQEKRPVNTGGYPDHEAGTQAEFDAVRRAGIDTDTANELLDTFDSAEEIKRLATDDPDTIVDAVDNLGKKRVARLKDVDVEGARNKLAGGEAQVRFDQVDDLALPEDSTLVLVGCGSAKNEGTHPAKDLYSSTYFKKKREYAEAAGDDWLILSAEHGVVDPEESIEDYDTNIEDVDAEAWGQRVLDELPPLDGVDVEIFAGPDYIDPIEAELRERADTLSIPTEGLKIGKRMSWLDANAEADDRDNRLIPAQDGSDYPDLPPEIEEVARTLDNNLVASDQVAAGKATDDAEHWGIRKGTSTFLHYKGHDYTLRATKKTGQSWEWSLIGGEVDPNPPVPIEDQAVAIAWSKILMDANPQALHPRDPKPKFTVPTAAGEAEVAAMSDNNNTYDPTDEFVDDTAQQDTLVDDSKRASSDTETRIDQGGSEEFADDRTYDPTDDVDDGKQASLGVETVDDGGQMDLTGDTATNEPGYVDDDDGDDGDDWRDALDVDEGDDDDGDDEPGTPGPWTGEERGQIVHHAKNGRLQRVLSVAKVPYAPDTMDNFAAAGIESPADLVEHYDEHGDFEAVEGVGPHNSDKIVDAIPIVRAAIHYKPIPEPGEGDPNNRYGVNDPDIPEGQIANVDGPSAPEFVGEWDQTDEEDILAWEGDGMRLELVEEDGDVTPWIENLESASSEPVTKARAEFSDWRENAMSDAIDWAREWLAETTPAEARQELPEWAQDRGGDTGEVEAAIETIRDEYEDTYGDRVEFISDIRDVADDAGIDLPSEMASEGVTQPMLRFQNIDPADAVQQAKRHLDSPTKWERIEDALTAYADQIDTGDDDPDTDDADREAALDRMADGAWNQDVIETGFGVAPNVAQTLEEQGRAAGDVIKWENNFDGLDEMPGIGESSAQALREAIPELKSRAVTKGQGMLVDDDQGEPVEVDQSIGMAGGESEYTGPYDPTREYDTDDLQQPGGISGWGDDRRKTLDAIEAKGRLDDVQSFDSLDEMTDALREISLAHPDGRLKFSPPEDAIDRLEYYYGNLPNEGAKQAYLNDDTIHRRINAARKQFNSWLGKQKRRDQIPSTAEAGPSNYPADKANKTARYAREAQDELDEKLNRVYSAAKGARQRALNAIGSSVAEQNQKEADEKAQSMKEKLEPGDIVFYSSTSYGLAPWGVKRLNDKSVRLKRPHGSAGMEKPMSDGETYPEYDLTTADYDSSRLRSHYEPDEIDEFDPEQIDSERLADLPDALTEGYEPTIRHLMGDGWVDDNLDLADESSQGRTYDPTEEFGDDYGPTSRRPTPEDERKEVEGGTVDERRLTGTGLTPHDFDTPGKTPENYTTLDEPLHMDDESPTYDPSDEVKNPAEIFGSQTSSTDVEKRPTNPRAEGGETGPVLIVGRADWPLPPVWDGWNSTVTGSPQFTGDSRPSHKGTHVIYLDPTRTVGLHLTGTEGGNKWSMRAERYAEPMPENPTGEQAQFGPNGQDSETARRRLTTSNTASATAWSEFEKNALTVDEVRSKVRDPAPPETDTVEAEQSIGAAGDTPGEIRRDTETDLGPVQRDLYDSLIRYKDDDKPDGVGPTAKIKSVSATLSDEEIREAILAANYVVGTGDRYRPEVLLDESDLDRTAVDLDDADISNTLRSELKDPPGDWRLTTDTEGRWRWEHPALDTVSLTDKALGPEVEYSSVILGNDVEQFDWTYSKVAGAKRYDDEERAYITVDQVLNQSTDWYDRHEDAIEEMAGMIPDDPDGVAEILVDHHDRDIPVDNVARIMRAANHYATNRLDAEGLLPWHQMMVESGVIDEKGAETPNEFVDAGDDDQETIDQADTVEVDQSIGMEPAGGTVRENPERIEWGRRDAANDWRDEHEEYLTESDNRVEKTVTLRPDTPEDVLDDAATQATISQRQEKKYGSAELTDSEKDALQSRPDWHWNDHAFHARASKAVLLEEGGTPWLDYYDKDINPRSHIDVIESGRDMAVEQGTNSPGEMSLDTEESDAEIAQRLDKAKGEQCQSARDACEDGHEEACRSLLEDCDWSEAEIDRLLESTRALGEQPEAVYDPTAEDIDGDSMDFGEWARQAEPDDADPAVPEKPDPIEEPTDEELAELAPDTGDDELPPAALSALKKAWGGYKSARAQSREANEQAEKYAEIINGVRAVNGQGPIDFNDLDGWDGGEVVTDDPDETYPAGDGQQKTLVEATMERAKQASSELGTTYDPTEDLK